jgi:hypothetical protein
MSILGAVINVEKFLTEVLKGLDNDLASDDYVGYFVV